MKKHLITILSFLVLFTGIAAADDISTKLNKLGLDTPKDSLPMIDFELNNLSGVKEKLSDYKGKVIFLNFWATWCPPCKEEMPAMENMYKALKDEGFVIVAVDLAEEGVKVQKFVDDKGLTFPVLLDEKGQAGGIYGAQSIPTTYIIGRDGNIIGRAVGGRSWDDKSYLDLFREILEK